MPLTGMPQCLLDNVGGFLRPHEGCGLFVPVLDVEADVTNEVAHLGEGTAANRLACEDPKPRLDEVQPGGSLRSEVKVDARVFFEPATDGRSGVSAGVVEDDVELLAAESGGEGLEKLQELGSVGIGPALADHSAARHFEAAYRLVTPARR